MTLSDFKDREGVSMQDLMPILTGTYNPHDLLLLFIYTSDASRYADKHQGSS